MDALARLADWIDAFGLVIGRAVKWLAVALVVNQFIVVVLRYIYGSSFIWMQEGVVYFHAALFMLSIAYTFLIDNHVRVDIYSERWSLKTRAIIELLGILITVWPFCWLVVWASWPYVSTSWRLGEGPMAVGGLPFTPALKSLIPVMAILLAIQGLSVAIRSLLCLTGRATTLFPHKPRQRIEA